MPETAVEGGILGVDVGGTFTDAVLVLGDRVFRAKRPTTPDDQSVGVLDAVGAVLDEAGRSADEVISFAHGTTVATNALLEGKVARTAFVATEGFTDLVEIGRQERPSLYRLDLARPDPLAPEELRFGVAERAGRRGVTKALTPAEVDRTVRKVERARPEAVAVCLLHADRHPEHERVLGRALEAELGSSIPIALSSESVGTFREYERASTTEIDAALGPVAGPYLDRLAARAVGAGLPAPLVMQSSGGLTSLEEAGSHPARTILSGPAGGSAAAALIARKGAGSDLICLDMGGTSCDVSVIEGGNPGETSGRSIGGRPVALPAIDIETVGAGGGSIAWMDSGGALRVGPHSAGADPGPACYGRGGGEPTVTDANLVLGRLPEGSTLSGIAPDPDASRAALESIAGRMRMSVEAAALGILEVANAQMAGAVRVMTVERGLDPAGFALLAFGGAGPLHATDIAAILGIEEVLIPWDCGVFSALGLAAADTRSDEAISVLRPLSAFDRGGIASLRGDADEVVWDLRYVGQAFELEVTCPEDEPEAVRSAFEESHQARFGFSEPDGEVELVTVRRRFTAAGPGLPLAARGVRGTAGPEALDLGVATAWVGEGWRIVDGVPGCLRIVPERGAGPSLQE